MSFESLLLRYISNSFLANVSNENIFSSEFIIQLVRLIHEKSTKVVEFEKCNFASNKASACISNDSYQVASNTCNSTHIRNDLLKCNDGKFHMKHKTDTRTASKLKLNSVSSKKNFSECEDEWPKQVIAVEKNQHLSQKNTRPHPTNSSLKTTPSIFQKLNIAHKPSKSVNSLKSEFDIASPSDFPSLLNSSSRDSVLKNKTKNMSHPKCNRRRIKPTTVSKSKTEFDEYLYNRNTNDSGFEGGNFSEVKTHLAEKHKSLLTARFSNSAKHISVNGSTVDDKMFSVR